MLGATGGFALVASGLLPAWLFEEAEAADKPPAQHVQRRKEQRHSKRRHQRGRRHKKHRDQRSRQGTDQPHEIEFVPHVNGGHMVAANFSVKKGDTFQAVDGRYIMPNESAHFRTPYSAACLQIYGGTPAYPFFFLVDSPADGPPTLTMGHHGTSSAGWTDATIVFSKELAEGEMSPPMKVDGFSFRVTRLANSAKFRVFDVAIAPPIS